jgi:hypothetical protein
MKIIHSLFTTVLILLGTLCLAATETNSATNVEASIKSQEKEMTATMRSFGAARGQSWTTNYYGKTMSSLGDILEIRIDRTIRSTPDWMHSDLWKIIEESKVQDYPTNRYYSHRFMFSPAFRIEYSSGLRVQATSSDVMIVLPDGRKGSALLEVKP